MFSRQRNYQGRKRVGLFYKKSGMYLISIIVLFVFIGVLTTIKPAYRFSSNIISEWTSGIDSSTFLYLISMENKAFKQAFPKDTIVPKLSNIFFQIATNIEPNDPRSLLGKELPGFSSFGNRIIIAGEGTSYKNLSIESSPPLEDVLKDREAISEESDEPSEDIDDDKEKQTENPTTGDRDVVFYTLHIIVNHFFRIYLE